MGRVSIITVITLTLLWGVLSANAQNPFIAKESPPKASAVPGLPHPFLDRIGDWQQQLNQKIAALIREARERGSIQPLLSLIAIAFIYGVLHAAGPGHGKAVATSYLLSRGRKLSGGILLGNSIAFFHGVSGVVLVLAVHFVLKSGISGSLESVTRTTQLISYGLIVLLGAVLLTKSLFSWRSKPGNEGSYQTHASEEKRMAPLAMALAVGLVPCPGVVLVMLFCLSLNAVGLGLVLAFFLILGMAMTISAVGVAGLAGKNLAFGVLERRHRLVKRFQRIIESAAAFLVMLLGLLFLVTAL
jgi:ABC-type nickel/cobalt efflux system permease component RcnA